MAEWSDNGRIVARNPRVVNGVIRPLPARYFDTGIRVHPAVRHSRAQWGVRRVPDSPPRRTRGARLIVRFMRLSYVPACALIRNNNPSELVEHPVWCVPRQDVSLASSRHPEVVNQPARTLLLTHTPGRCRLAPRYRAYKARVVCIASRVHADRKLYLGLRTVYGSDAAECASAAPECFTLGGCSQLAESRL